MFGTLTSDEFAKYIDQHFSGPVELENGATIACLMMQRNVLARVICGFKDMYDGPEIPAPVVN